ncbi:MAG: restriction endonuclease subunit S [Firmicutes bacterium]|nr:restriction endonuclease subunit S [Bacillota bacterium]
MSKKCVKPQIRFVGFDEDWERRKLGEVAEIVGGGTPSTSIKDYWDGNIDWYTPAEIAEQIYITSSQRKITEEGYNHSSAKMLPVGTVLFTSRAGIGKTVILSRKGCTNQGFQSIVPHKDKLDSYFIFSRGEELKRYGETIGAGSTFVEVSGKQMANMELMLPKIITEQQVIGAYFEKLNKLITLHQSKYDKLVNIKKSMLEKMFPKNGSNVPEIRFKGFSGDWEWRKLDEWGTFYYGRSCPKWSITENATIPCIRYGELYTKYGTKVDTIYSYTNMSSENLRFSKGTEVLIPRVGEDPMDYNHCTWLSIPDVAIGEMISVFNTKNNPLFTATMFNATLQNEFAMRVEGGSVTNLYFEKLKNIEVSFPKLKEQKKIGEYFETLDKLITLHQRKVEKLQNIKKACMEKMFV